MTLLALQKVKCFHNFLLSSNVQKGLILFNFAQTEIFCFNFWGYLQAVEDSLQKVVKSSTKMRLLQCIDGTLCAENVGTLVKIFSSFEEKSVNV